MFGQIVTENGVKKIKSLTADVGAGNPVGTIIVVCSNQIPSNYLPLGTQFDTSLYPVLYALLGTDTTPTASALGLPTLSSGQYAIKATSGLSENAQDNVINTLNEQRSYSTEEVNTGKTWIDGKQIYRKVVDIENLPNATTKDVAHNISNFGQLVKVYGIWYDGTWYNPLPFAGTSSAGASITVNVNATYVRVQTGTNRSSSTGVVTIEYTKAS